MARVLVYKGDLLPVSETFIAAQVRALSRWSPVLYGLRDIGGLPLTGLPLHFPYGPNPPAWMRKGLRLAALANILPSRAVKIPGPTVNLVHAHFGNELLYARPLARRLGVPLLVTLHGFDINSDEASWRKPGSGALNRWYPERLQDAIRAGVKFIAVSNSIRRKAIERGVPEHNIETIHIGIDTAFFQPGSTPITDRPNRVLFVGRLVEKKGVAVLIDAFLQLKVKIPDAELVIVGEGPLRNDLEARSRSLPSGIRFTGALAPAAVRTLLNESRVLCLPSVTASNGDAEGFGMVLLEAQACGVPVVTSARGGAEEGLIDGVTGLTFPEHDSGALTEQLSQLLGMPTMLAAFAAAAHRFVRDRFDVRVCTAKLEAHYDLIVGSTHG